MSNEKHEQLALEIQKVIRNYGFENATLTQAHFLQTDVGLSSNQKPEDAVPFGCRLERDPETGKWKVVCD